MEHTREAGGRTTAYRHNCYPKFSWVELARPQPPTLRKIHVWCHEWMMFQFNRISALHLLSIIFSLGFTSLALILLSPGARVTIWLGDHWQSLGLVLALVYLACRIVGFAQHKAKPPSDVHDQTLREDYQTWGENELADYDNSLELMILLRDEALNAAAKLPIPDAIYRIVTYNSSCSLPFNIDPGELDWLTSMEQFEEWARRTNKLRNAAYHVGDAGMRQNGTYDAARDKLIAENPGFNEDTYKRAISYGYQMAR